MALLFQEFIDKNIYCMDWRENLCVYLGNGLSSFSQQQICKNDIGPSKKLLILAYTSHTFYIEQTMHEHFGQTMLWTLHKNN